MTNIILCEGETDAILIGYYMGKVCNWSFTKEEFHFKNEKNLKWYVRGDDKLGIWSCGGCDFSIQLKCVSDFIKNGGLIDKMLVIADNDDDGSKYRVEEYLLQSDILSNKLQKSLSISYWHSLVVEGFGDAKMELAYILLPRDEYGALETFMLRSIENGAEDKKEVITQVKQFLQNFHSEIYLKRRREKVKAELGVSLSIFSPDKVFDTMNEIIKSVPWEEYALVNKTFEILKSI